MQTFLGLGSNLGDRRNNLREALTRLQALGVAVQRVSPVVESPAMLPPHARDDWNRPFLNLVAECATERDPESLLGAVKSIELDLGRTDPRRWSPRPIDIDILLYEDQRVASELLSIPHPGLADRSFFLTPLVGLQPDIDIVGLGATAIELSARTHARIPLWMGIVNLTPDSFSDGGTHESWDEVEATIDSMIASGVHYLDFGAESTRPGAATLTAAGEWERLEPVLNRVIDKLGGDMLRPRLSVDTYHPEVAARALAMGIDIINDVSGLTDSAMIGIAAETNAVFVAMHNLGLPADPAVTLRTDASAVGEIERWLDGQLQRWQRAGIEPGRIIFDPGIGFGKTRLQSLDVLRHVDRFLDRGIRVLVGHSRKSFMGDFAGASQRDRDLATIGGSMVLCERGVDIIRVHNVEDHVLAYRGWSHLNQRD